MRNTLTIAFAIMATPLKAAELILFEFDGCLWCERWKTEVGKYYAQTAEGIKAPVRVVDIFDPRPSSLKNIGAIRATPTFVLMDEETEIGRIVGYQDEKTFWIQYTRLLTN